MDQEDFDELPEEDPKWKKILLITGGCFLIFIILIYYLSPMDIVEGFIVSQSIENNSLIKGGLEVRFGSSYEELRKHYLENQRREVKACLLGEIKNDVYNVDKIVFPEVLDASVFHVRSMSCPEGTIVELHSHPWHKCVASKVDVEGLRMKQKTNSELIMIVMCSTTRFAVYR